MGDCSKVCFDEAEHPPAALWSLGWGRWGGQGRRGDADMETWVEYMGYLDQLMCQSPRVHGSRKIGV